LEDLVDGGRGEELMNMVAYVIVMALLGGVILMLGLCMLLGYCCRPSPRASAVRRAGGLPRSGTGVLVENPDGAWSIAMATGD
jgi:hypothetical protein